MSKEEKYTYDLYGKGIGPADDVAKMLISGKIKLENILTTPLTQGECAVCKTECENKYCGPDCKEYSELYSRFLSRWTYLSFQEIDSLIKKYRTADKCKCCGDNKEKKFIQDNFDILCKTCHMCININKNADRYRYLSKYV